MAVPTFRLLNSLIVYSKLRTNSHQLKPDEQHPRLKAHDWSSLPFSCLLSCSFSRFFLYIARLPSAQLCLAKNLMSLSLFYSNVEQLSQKLKYCSGATRDVSASPPRKDTHHLLQWPRIQLLLQLLLQALCSYLPSTGEANRRFKAFLRQLFLTYDDHTKNLPTLCKAS